MSYFVLHSLLFTICINVRFSRLITSVSEERESWFFCYCLLVFLLFLFEGERK